MQEITNHNQLIIEDLTVSYKGKKRSVTPFSHLSLALNPGEIVFLSGESGSGKTTLLHAIGGLITPQEGKITYRTKAYFSSDDSVNDMTSFRHDAVSFVFQDYNLLDDFSVLDNLRIVSSSDKAILEILEKVGLSSLKDTPARFLSGGEKQRVAIARALLSQKDVLLLDEPSANLDQENADVFYQSVRQIAPTRFILITCHDHSLIERYGDKGYELSHGELKELPLNRHASFHFEPFRFSSSTYADFLLTLKRENGLVNLHIEEGEHTQTVTWSSDESYEELGKALEPYVGKNISITLESNTVQKLTPVSKETPSLGGKLSLHYAWKAVRRRIGMTILGMFFALLSASAFVTSYSAFQNPLIPALDRSFASAQISYAPVQSTRRSPAVNQNYTAYTGYQLWQETRHDANCASYPVWNAHLGDGRELVSLLVVGDETFFEGRVVTLPSTDEIVLTSYYSDYIGLGDTTNVTVDRMEASKDFRCSYISIPVDETILRDISRGKATKQETDILNQRYRIGFISYEGLSRFFQEKASLRELTPSPFSAANDTFVEEGMQIYYKPSSDSLTYAAGSKPNPDYLIDVAINQTFFDHLQYIDPATFTNVSDAVGKQLYFRKLYTLKNAIAYQNTFDASIEIDAVRITGVTSDTNVSTIYCSASLWPTFIDLKLYYGDAIRVSTAKEDITSVTKQGLHYSTNEAKTIYSYHDIFSNSFLPLAICVEILFGSLSLFLFANMLRQILNSKEKEYCVLSIVGVPRRQIIGNIVSYSATLLGLAFLLSWGGGSLFLYLLNLLFRSPQSFQLSFSLLSLNGWSLLIVFGLVLLAIGIIVLRGLKITNAKNLSAKLRTFD